MSKAFTRERDDEDDDDEVLGVAPDTSKNYITPHGFLALKSEYEQLLNTERPRIVDIVSWAASNGDRSENGDYLYGKKRLREIDRRVRFLARRMKQAVVVDPDLQTQRDRVFFGATVTYADEEDMQRTITIVGQDEVDPARGRVSWISPIARAVIRARVGDVVALQTPSGVQEIEILAISYAANGAQF
jgi:transcription elongation factor GreB